MASTYKYPVERVPQIKLLILYIVEQVRSVCKKDQTDRLWMTDFVMLNIATDYFKFQCVLGEMVTEGYLTKEEKDGKELLAITELGMRTVGYFYTELPHSVRVTVDKGLISSLKEKKSKDSVYAEYVYMNENVHMAALRLYDEGIPQMSLTITMADKQTAVDLSKAMRKNPSVFYKKMIEACDEALAQDLTQEEK